LYGLAARIPKTFGPALWRQRGAIPTPKMGTQAKEKEKEEKEKEEKEKEREWDRG